MTTTQGSLEPRAAATGRTRLPGAFRGSPGLPTPSFPTAASRDLRQCISAGLSHRFAAMLQQPWEVTEFTEANAFPYRPPGTATPPNAGSLFTLHTQGPQPPKAKFQEPFDGQWEVVTQTQPWCGDSFVQKTGIFFTSRRAQKRRRREHLLSAGHSEEIPHSPRYGFYGWSQQGCGTEPKGFHF